MPTYTHTTTIASLPLTPGQHTLKSRVMCSENGYDLKYNDTASVNINVVSADNGINLLGADFLVDSNMFVTPRVSFSSTIDIKQIDLKIDTRATQTIGPGYLMPAGSYLYFNLNQYYVDGSELGDGSHTYQLTVTDYAGNTRTINDSFTLNLTYDGRRGSLAPAVIVNTQYNDTSFLAGGRGGQDSYHNVPASYKSNYNSGSYCYYKFVKFLNLTYNQVYYLVTPASFQIGRNASLNGFNPFSDNGSTEGAAEAAKDSQGSTYYYGQFLLYETNTCLRKFSDVLIEIRFTDDYQIRTWHTNPDLYIKMFMPSDNSSAPSVPYELYTNIADIPYKSKNIPSYNNILTYDGLGYSSLTSSATDLSNNTIRMIKGINSFNQSDVIAALGSTTGLHPYNASNPYNVEGYIHSPDEKMFSFPTLYTLDAYNVDTTKPGTITLNFSDGTSVSTNVVVGPKRTELYWSTNMWAGGIQVTQAEVDGKTSQRNAGNIYSQFTEVNGAANNLSNIAFGIASSTQNVSHITVPRNTTLSDSTPCLTLSVYASNGIAVESGETWNSTYPFTELLACDPVWVSGENIDALSIKQDFTRHRMSSGTYNGQVQGKIELRCTQPGRLFIRLSRAVIASAQYISNHDTSLYYYGIVVDIT